MTARSAALLLLAAAAWAAPEAPKTVIKGRRMEVLGKGEATRFDGEVTLTRGTDFMSADRMVNRDSDGVTEAWGNVYLRRRDPVRGTVSEAWGDRGLYDSGKVSGRLWGGVFVEIHESTPAARLTRAWADAAAYDASSGAFSLQGAPQGKTRRAPPPWPAGVLPKPRVVQSDGKGARDLWGERVTFFEADGRVTAEGNVKAFWEGGDVPAR